MTSDGMMAAVAMAAGLDEKRAETITVDAAFIAKHFPEIAQALKADGAKAERDRIAGIDGAALPGHEKLVAAYKADPEKSPADLALAIIAAEKTARAAQLSNLDADEAKLKGLRSEPANADLSPKSPLAGLSGEALWKAEYANDATLRSEFSGEAAYLSFKKMEAEGRVKIFGKKIAA